MLMIGDDQAVRIVKVIKSHPLMNITAQMNCVNSNFPEMSLSAQLDSRKNVRTE